MLKKMLENDAFRLMFEHSHFKEAELDSLLVKRLCSAKGITLSEGTRYKDRPSSVGALVRSAKQGETALRKSIATLVLGMYLGLIPDQMLLVIPKLRDVLASMENANITEKDLREVLSLLSAALQATSS